MKNKLEVLGLLPFFVTFVETQFSTKIKCVQSDNGPEFKLTNFWNLKESFIIQPV